MQHEWRCTNYYSTKNIKTGWFSVVILLVVHRFFGGIDFHKKPRRRPRWSRQGNDRIAPQRDLKTGPSSMCLCLLARCGSNGHRSIFRWRHCNSGMLFSMALFCVFFGVCEGHRIVSLFSLKPFVRQINQQTNPHIVVAATSSGSPIINMAVTASNLHLKMVSQPWWHAHHAGHDLWSAFLTTDLMFQIL